MRRLILALAVVSLALLGAVPGRVAESRRKQDPLVERVRRAIDGGIKYLRAQERGNGNLENTYESHLVPGGLTALSTLALLNAGVPPDDPLIQRCLKYLRTVPRDQTYVVGLQTMVYVAAGQNEDRERIQKNVDWLIEARHMQGGQLMGWSYTRGGPVTDNSNTQYALLGLHEGHVAGAKIPKQVWQSIQDYYTDNQVAGGWGYHLGEAPTATMTEAGFCGLLIAGMDLNSGLEQLHADGTVTRCGEYQTDRHLANALALLNQQMPRTKQRIARMPHAFYWLYGLERCGRLSGQRFFGEV
ncbi:MAG TPA: hypothetical protein VJ739_15340, partial [Gemmataceae bacterium]|nr:hypothetical protein [Gemmataceae bacterium]